MKIESFFRDQDRHVRFLLGLYISKKRKERGFSIKDVATQTELPPQTVTRIETGRMNINSEQFAKIHSLLSFDPDELNEIRKIASVRYINDLSKVLIPQYQL